MMIMSEQMAVYVADYHHHEFFITLHDFYMKDDVKNMTHHLGDMTLDVGYMNVDVEDHNLPAFFVVD